jgi:DNA-binding transcriptional LysR family regulator
MIEQACLDAGVAPRVEMRLDGVDAAKRMVENGMGISFVPRSAAMREVDAGSLAIVRLGPEHRMVLSTCVLVRRAKRQPDNVRALMGVLQALYATPSSHQ